MQNKFDKLFSFESFYDEHSQNDYTRKYNPNLFTHTSPLSKMQTYNTRKKIKDLVKLRHRTWNKWNLDETTGSSQTESQYEHPRKQKYNFKNIALVISANTRGDGGTGGMTLPVTGGSINIAFQVSSR